MSLHRSDNKTFFPYREDCGPEYCGKGKGLGYNVNIAWHTGTVVDEVNRDANVLSDLGCNEYVRACETLLFPLAREFKPDLILVSCGFDGAIHDFLGWSQLCPMMYFWMT